MSLKDEHRNREGASEQVRERTLLQALVPKNRKGKGRTWDSGPRPAKSSSPSDS